MPTLAEAAPGSAVLLNPATMHTIAPVDVAGAVAADTFSSRTPDDVVKTAVALTGDALLLEQKGKAAAALYETKRNPATDTSLMGIEFSAEGDWKDTVKTTRPDAAK